MNELKSLVMKTGYAHTERHNPSPDGFQEVLRVYLSVPVIVFS